MALAAKDDLQKKVGVATRMTNETRKQNAEELNALENVRNCVLFLVFDLILNFFTCAFFFFVFIGKSKSLCIGRGSRSLEEKN
jgi:hypothetical protein